MRPSVAPSRVSHAHALAAQANNTASAHRLLEKKKEYEAVAALERASALFVKRIEALADDCQVMADAGQGESPHARGSSVLIVPDRPQSMAKCSNSGQTCSAYLDSFVRVRHL